MTQLIPFRFIAVAAVVAAVALPLDAQAQRRQSLADRVTALEGKLAQGGNNEDRQTLTDLVFRLSEMEEELRQLRGQIENQAFEMENLKKGELDRFNDLDRRLTELSQQAPAPSTRPPLVSGPTTGSPIGPQIGPSSTPGTDSGSASGPGASQDGNGTVGAGDFAGPSDPESAREEYLSAFQALKDGRYDESARLFSNFLQTHPSDALAGNAQYWLGESYYVTRNYKIGQETFKDLLELFPDSDKVPDARLKLGFSQLALKQYSSAKATLTAVSADYPGTPVARLAENRLRTMRIEGHIQ